MLLKEIEHLYEEYGDEPEKIILSGPISHNQIVCDKVKTVALYFHSIGKGGVQRVLSLLIPIYMELGYKVVLITEEEARCSDYEVSEKVKRYVIPKEGQVVSGQIKYLERAEKIAKILKAENVDVFCHHNAMSSLLFYDMLAVKNAGVWFILVKHQVFSCELLKGKNYYKKYKKIFNYMDEVIVLSEIEAEYWKKLGISSKYIPNPANPQIKKNENGSEEYILWEGRLDKTPKNYLDAVEIMNCVVKKVPNAIMKIYGSGSLADERELLSAIKKNSLQKNVFYCGYTTDINEIFCDASIQLVTSDYEAFPMGIFEGKMYGLPLVTYSMPYLELLKDKKGYISVPAGGIEEAALAIIELLKNQNLRDKMKREAYESVESFTNGNVKEKWKNVFEELENCKDLSGGKDEQFVTIMDTVFQHVDRSREKEKTREDDLYDTIWRRCWLYELKYRLLKERKQLAIFPYGNIGRAVLKFLEDNDVSVDYIVDNFCEDKGIISVKEMKSIETDNLIVLICSNNRELYYDIRNDIEQLVKKENIIDMYPESFLQKGINLCLKNTSIDI